MNITKQIDDSRSLKYMADQYVLMEESRTVYAVVYKQRGDNDEPIYYYRVEGEQVKANEQQYIEHFAKKYLEMEMNKNKYKKQRNKLKI